MTHIYVHADVRHDLERIQLLDTIAATRIIAFIQQVKADPDLLAKLTTHSYRSHDDNLDVKKWIQMHNTGNPVWRLRFVDFAYRVPDYRIFYIASPATGVVHILAICERQEIDYDDISHPICSRVARSCAQLSATGQI